MPADGGQLRSQPVFALVGATVHRTVAFNGFESTFQAEKETSERMSLFLVGEGGFEESQKNF